MIAIRYSEEFLREVGKLPALLQEEVEEKVELFKDRANHQRLRGHKLKGALADCWSFSVNYRFRILFTYIGRSKNNVYLITIGDHDIYK